MTRGAILLDSDLLREIKQPYANQWGLLRHTSFAELFIVSQGSGVQIAISMSSMSQFISSLEYAVEVRARTNTAPGITPTDSANNYDDRLLSRNQARCDTVRVDP